jgi:hypothetical protein
MNHRDRPVVSLLKGFATASFLCAVIGCFASAPKGDRIATTKTLEITKAEQSAMQASPLQSQKPPAVENEKTSAVGDEKSVAVGNQTPVGVAKEELVAAEDDKPVVVAKEKPNRVAKVKPVEANKIVTSPKPEAPKGPKIAQRVMTKAGNQGAEMQIPMSAAPIEPQPTAGPEPDLLMVPYQSGD